MAHLTATDYGLVSLSDAADALEAATDNLEAHLQACGPCQCAEAERLAAELDAADSIYCAALDSGRSVHAAYSRQGMGGF